MGDSIQKRKKKYLGLEMLSNIFQAQFSKIANHSSSTESAAEHHVYLFSTVSMGQKLGHDLVESLHQTLTKLESKC